MQYIGGNDILFYLETSVAVAAHFSLITIIIKFRDCWQLSELIKNWKFKFQVPQQLVMKQEINASNHGWRRKDSMMVGLTVKKLKAFV